MLLSIEAFCDDVIDMFGKEYLRESTEADLVRIMRINAARGFPGCLRSMNCQHREWKNFPVAWAFQYKWKWEKK